MIVIRSAETKGLVRSVRTGSYWLPGCTAAFSPATFCNRQPTWEVGRGEGLASLETNGMDDWCTYHGSSSIIIIGQIQIRSVHIRKTGGERPSCLFPQA